MTRKGSQIRVLLLPPFRNFQVFCLEVFFVESEQTFRGEAEEKPIRQPPPHLKASKYFCLEVFFVGVRTGFSNGEKKSQFANLPPFRKASKSFAWKFFCDGESEQAFRTERRKANSPHSHHFKSRKFSNLRLFFIFRKFTLVRRLGRRKMHFFSF